MWAYAERVAEGTQVVHLIEPLDERSARPRMHMRDVQADVTIHQSRINVERTYVDKNFTNIEQSLMGRSRQMNLVEEITKNWNRL